MADIYVATTGNDTTGDGSSGNPYASPGKAAGVASAGDAIHLKSGTYTLSSSSSNVAGGRVTLNTSVRLEGYGTTAGDLGTPPVIDAGAITGISIVTMSGSFNDSSSGLVNVVLDGNAGASNNGVTDNTSHSRVLCRVLARDCPGTGFVLAATAVGAAAMLTASGCGTGFSANGSPYSLYQCLAINCTSDGFVAGVNGMSFSACIAAGNGGQGFDCSWGARWFGCIAYDNASDGFKINSGHDIFALVDCVAVLNGGYGLNAATGYGLVVNYAAGSGAVTNTSGASAGTNRIDITPITLTADPFVDAASDDFNLNNTSGGGADLRAVTYDLPGGGGTAVYPFMDLVVPSAAPSVATLRSFTNIGTY